MADVATLITSVQAGAQGLNDQIGSTFQFGFTATLLLVALAFVIGILASLLISSGVARAAKAVLSQMQTIETAMGEFTGCLEGLSDNDLTRIYQSHVPFMEHVGTDEIGETAGGLNSLLAQIKKMVDAYEVSRANLVGIVGEVKAAAAFRVRAWSSTTRQTRPGPPPSRSRARSTKWQWAHPTRLARRRRPRPAPRS